MVGIGETMKEVSELMKEIYSTGCTMLTIGQYLAPSLHHYPVKEYIRPEVFDQYEKEAGKIGFRSVVSGPFVRSSYLAEYYSGHLLLMEKNNI